MFNYLKYFLYLLVTLPVIIATTLGGHWMWYGFLGTLAIYIPGDLLLGDDNEIPQYQHKGFLDAVLFLSLPVMLGYWFVFIWHAAAPGVDPMGYGAWGFNTFGFDAIAARDATTTFDYVGGFLSAALIVTTISTLVAHELTHRTWDAKSMFVGRWLLAFSWDVGFATEHVYGHHTYVGTTEDPATAPRGRNVWKQILIASWETNRNAWNLEKSRLTKKGQAVFSLNNLFIRGQLMSLSIAAAAWYISGWKGVLFFLGMCVGAKIMLEIVNYMEHYGIARVIGQPVQPHHSWNSNKKISSWATFNLTRHSHHHAQGEVPFYDLKPYQDAPMMVNGYLSVIVLTLVPPIWNMLMVPKLLEWDQKYATAEEKLLAGKQNWESGIPELMKHTYGYQPPVTGNTARA